VGAALASGLCLLLVAALSLDNSLSLSVSVRRLANSTVRVTHAVACVKASIQRHVESRTSPVAAAQPTGVSAEAPGAMHRLAWSVVPFRAIAVTHAMACVCGPMRTALPPPVC
jgi:hypothetical protein